MCNFCCVHILFGFFVVSILFRSIVAVSINRPVPYPKSLVITGVGLEAQATPFLITFYSIKCD